MMYSNNYGVPTYETHVYENMPYTSTSGYPSTMANSTVPVADGERFFFAPFVLGGLAGTALGYGIANNNRPPYPVYYPPMMMPQPYPTYTTNYYY